MQTLRWIHENDNVARANIACNFYIDVIRRETSNEVQWWYVMQEYDEAGYQALFPTQRIRGVSNFSEAEERAVYACYDWLRYRLVLLGSVFMILEKEAKHLDERHSPWLRKVGRT